MLPRSGAPSRRILRITLKVFGGICAIAGAYFAVLAVQSLILIVSLARSGPRSAGLAAPAVAMFGGLQIIEVLVFGAVAAFLLAIGAAVLQPLSYLRSRRR